MCGIAGIITGRTENAGERLACMTNALAHRGPDDDGMTAFENVFLGHRRLSVIDLSAQGHQPMADAKTESAWIVFNGEIYNFNSARAALEDKGYRFRSHTDTEVLLNLYRAYGAPALFPHLNGMFAFALHDRARHKVLLARDRLGVKPLYYTVINGELLFASELKAIFAALGYQPSLQPAALGQYFLQGFVSAPDTAFENVFALSPGHYLEIDVREFLRAGRAPETIEYWDAPFTGDDARPVEAIQRELAELLSDAVRLRMIADVPLGAFLSGGIDSSALVALMARSNNDGAQPVRTFCVDVPGFDRSERAKAAAVAGMYHTAHTEIAAEATGAEDYWARLAHFDAPFNCPSLLNMWLVSRAARRDVTVALSGDGGDELFAGYVRYLEVARRASAATTSANALRPLLNATSNLLPHDLRGRARLATHGMDDFMFFLTLNHPLSIRDAERLTGTSLQDWVARMRAIYGRHPADGAVTRACYLDLKNYMTNHINAKVDNASMAVALEVRTPFLDYRVVELAGRIPAKWKIKNGTGKWILKDMVKDWLPDGLTAQKKVGFDPPLAEWAFDASLNERLDELLSAQARWRGVLDNKLIERWIMRLRHPSTVTRSLRVPRRAALWALYQFERWLAMQNENPISTSPEARAASWHAQPCSPVPSTRI